METTLSQDWKIGIISTDYDLTKIRAKLIDLVSILGFEPIAFELSSMRKEPGVHSHEACVVAIEVSDIIVLVIDKRFGGLYLGQGPYSVTEEEFFRAYNLEKVVIPCVSKAAFDDRHNSFRKVQKLIQDEGISEEEARVKVLPGYVDNWQVLDFIQRVRKMDRDQYLEIYTREEDLLEKIRGRLEGVSRYVCSRIVEEQIRWINSLRSTSGMFQSVGVVGNQKLFIDPPFKRISGITRKRKAVSILDSLQSRNTSILITGDPGAGKTILLAQAFKKHAGQAIRKKRYRLPFFLSLRGRGTRYHFKIMDYLSECCVSFLKKKPFPTMSLKDINPIFYIDGLDESTNVPSSLELARLAKCEIMKFPYVLCSRSEFAKQTVDTSMELGSGVEFHLRLLDWSKDEAISFVRKYSEFNDNQLVRARVEKLIDDVQEDHPIIKSPLILSLVLWLAYTDKSVISKDLALNTTYSWFIQKWASKEIQRYGETPISEIENASYFLIMCWEITAWIIYKYRNVGEDLRLSVLIDEVANSVDSNSQTQQIIESPLFESLLTFTVQHEMVTGMLHEQFLEYLLAKAFVKGCITGNVPYPDYLGYQINFEVNHFIKAIWAATNKRELHATLVNLKKAFISNLDGMDSETLNTRVNSIYYISRVPLWDETTKILEDFLRQPTDLYTKNGILFALVRLGDRDREKDLYNSLITNQDADAINRGLHLVYFKDWIPVGELPPYKDDGTLQWKRTLAGMMSHVESTEERFINSKRLDIYIIRSFIQTRKRLDGFTKDNLNRIRASVVELDNLGIVNQAYLKDIKHELSLLEELFDAARCEMG